MKFIKYIILGILQGVTEPLPISSSGHIFLFKSLFNTNMFNDFNLEIFLNFASFIAILLIFRKEVWELIVGFFDYLFKKNKKAKDLNNFKNLDSYIKNNCAVDCKYFVLKRSNNES